ncbi:nuclear export mediator factor NEMF [Iris pallida]|uniref:Nuclear export mediator factor NEMF n=1 Tax=Iris pallida TaxID=29817 RepID=A0AAX6FZC5_IRIPA|nr:nuclear export mediator factor NEMF [Iris pallida]
MSGTRILLLLDSLLNCGNTYAQEGLKMFDNLVMIVLSFFSLG